jgi:hypothetical protein
MLGTNGMTTDVLVERWGAIVARGHSDGYQFIAFANGLVYESNRWLCSDGITTIWLPWTRRPCHDVGRLAHLMSAEIEHA